jgi:Ca2+-binding RTX toxin-like protein
MAKATTITGTEGNDFIYLQESRSYVVNGLAGNDSLSGREWNDTLNGGANNDSLGGGDGDDVCNGGSGQDTLYADAGRDSLSGGAGDDQFYIAQRSDVKGDVITGGTGVDTLRFSVYYTDMAGAISFTAKGPNATTMFSQLFSLTGVERYDIDGLSGNDRVTGWIFGDFIDGNAGNDLLDGNGGDDIVNGGDGKDSIRGGKGADFMHGDDGDDRLDGGVGYDGLQGDAGNDTLRGEAGNDVLTGGFGADRLEGASGDDVIHARFESPYDLEDRGDVVTAGSGNDYVELGTDDSGDGGSGDRDTVSLRLMYDDHGESFTFDAGRHALSNGTIISNFELLDFLGGSGRDRVTGASLNDTLNGGQGDNSMKGMDGDDVLFGGDGKDELDGGAGNDLINDSRGSDKLLGGRGADTIQTGHDGMDRIDGGSGVDMVRFGYQTDRSTYLDLHDQSRNEGLARGDVYQNIESFEGSTMDDTMLGASGSDVFDGSQSDDVLDGRGGDDFLSGGQGSDLLIGGQGRDVFEFSDGLYPSGWHGDTIKDFTRGQDKLQISLVQFGFEDKQDFELVNGAGHDAKASGSLLMFDTVTHELWWDQDGKGENFDPQLIVTLDRVEELTSGDFLMV